MTITGFICGARYNHEEVKDDDCPKCNTRQKFLFRNEDWHGHTIICLGCGQVWMEDGEFEMTLSKERKAENVIYYNKIAKKIIRKQEKKLADFDRKGTE